MMHKVPSSTGKSSSEDGAKASAKKKAKKVPKSEDDGDEDSNDEHDQTYDPRKRDPQFAHAEKTCLWDLVNSLSNFSLPPSSFDSCVLKVDIQCNPLYNRSHS
jgi:hypothetical protein